VDLADIRARHAEVDVGRLTTIEADAAHADRAALLAMIDTTTDGAATYRAAQHYWEGRARTAEAALARLAGIVAEDIAVVLWGMDTQDCDRMGAAVLTFLRARVKGP
jgi:hypothetical protein